MEEFFSLWQLQISCIFLEEISSKFSRHLFIVSSSCKSLNNLKNYNIDQNSNINNITNSKINTTTDLQSLRCQTFNIDPKPTNGKLYVSYNKNATFKVSSYLFDKKQNIYKNKKPKKKVKFVDEVYNKSLIEEICIQSFKGYNMRNNYASSSNYSNCRICRKTACCSII